MCLVVKDEIKYKKLKVRPNSWLIIENGGKKSMVKKYVAYVSRVNNAV